MEPVFEFDVDFNEKMGQTLHYMGYRPTHDEFLKAGGPYSKYFKDKVGPDEELITNSYDATSNNLELDNRIKTFMRDNKLTVCETVYPDGKIPTTSFGLFRYAVNYSFDTYKTFGFITMVSWSEFDAETYYDRGVTYLRKGDNKKAIADFTLAIKFNSNYTGAYSNRGIAYYYNHNYDKAIADYTKALKLDPNDAEIFNNRGEGYQAMGDYEHAMADYNRAISLDPDNTVFQENRVHLQKLMLRA
jgi:tetratricopeptide (TPR) repeat protein